MRDVCAVRRRTGRRGVRNVLAVALLVMFAALVGAPPASATVPNPPWPARCPQRVVVVLDLSSSIDPYLPEVKKSASDLVDALRGAPNEVAVVTFGSASSIAVPLLDVGNDGERARLKDMVNDVGLLPGDGGGTNWEEALRTAASLDPGIVLFLTDGEPTVYGGPNTGYYGGGGDSLTPAVQVADGMRSSGTRIVGVGMGLQQSSVPNLVQVTGPVVGDDYYETGIDADGLLDKLYDIASKTCGIPVAALPQPEGGHFPVVPAVITALGTVLLAVIGGYLMSRRRSTCELGPVNRSVRKKPEPLKDPTIRMADVPPVVPDVLRTSEEHTMGRDTDAETAVRKPARRPGRMSLDRLHQAMDAQAAGSPAQPDPRDRGSSKDRP